MEYPFVLSCRLVFFFPPSAYQLLEGSRGIMSGIAGHISGAVERKSKIILHGEVVKSFPSGRRLMIVPDVDGVHLEMSIANVADRAARDHRHAVHALNRL